MKTGKLTVIKDEETVEFEEMILRSQDGKTELTFEEWFNELDIEIIFRKTRLDED